MRQPLLLLVSMLLLCSAHAQITNYKYQFNINGAQDTVYLANYLGKQLYYNDTAVADSKGTFIFSDSRAIKPGKFAVVQPGNMYFELLINEQSFTFNGDTADLIGGMTTENTLENKLFYNYIQLINNKKAEIQPLNAKYKAAKSDKEKEKILEKINALNKEVTDFQDNIISEHPTTLMAQIIKMNKDIEVPDAPIKADGSKDSTFGYYYYAKHYWDNTNLNNDALVRDPAYVKKLEQYFDKVLLQHPDTLASYADRLIGKMDESSEMFKITVNWLINHYSKSKIMGLDAVYVHMAENYYLTGKAFWADSATVAKLEERVKALSPTLIGRKAPAINLFDTTENRLVPLYSVDAKYTILYFWDPNCGHCKKETPKLKKIYDVVKDKGVEVYAVCTELETEDWKKFVREKELNWINVSDTPEKIIDNFRQTYDIYATPKVFLLDKDKKVLVKQVGVAQLGDILKDKLKLPKDLKYGYKGEGEKEGEEAQ